MELKLEKLTIVGFVIAFFIAAGIVVLEVNDALNISDYRRILAGDTSINLFILRNVSGSYELLGRSFNSEIEFYRWRFANDKLKLYFGTDLVDTNYWRIYEGIRQVSYKQNEITNLKQKTKGRYVIEYEAKYFKDSRYSDFVGTFLRRVEVYPSLGKETVEFIPANLSRRFNLRWIHETDDYSFSMKLDKEKALFKNRKGVVVDWRDAKSVMTGNPLKASTGRIQFQFTPAKAGRVMIDPVISADDPVGIKGKLIGSESVYWEKSDVGLLNVSSYVTNSGDYAVFNFTNYTAIPEVSGNFLIDIGIKVRNNALFVNYFEVARGSEESFFYQNCTTKTSKNGTPDLDCVKLEGMRQVDYTRLSVNNVTVNGDVWYYVTVNLSEVVKVKVPAYPARLGRVEYDVCVKPSGFSWNTVDRVCVDPVYDGVIIPDAVVYSSFDSQMIDERPTPVTYELINQPANINTTGAKIGAGYLNLTNPTIAQDGAIYFTRHDADNQTNITANMSYVLWFRTRTTGNYQTLFGENTLRTSCDAGLQSCGAYLGLWAENNHLSSGISDSDSSTSSILNGGGTINVDTWYHAVWRYDRTANRFSTLLNGADEQFITPIAGNNRAPANRFVIGNASLRQSPDLDLDTLDGGVDDLCLFDQYLNDTQVAAIYNSGSGNACGVGEAIAAESLNSINVTFPIDTQFTNLTYLNVTNISVNHTWFHFQNGTRKANYSNINATVILDFGTETDYQINVSACNATMCSRNFTVKLRHDNLTPLIDYASPTPANGISNLTNTITINVTWAEKNNNSHFITMDGTKYFDVNVSPTYFFRTFENLAIGAHSYSATINDSAGQNNETLQRTYTIFGLGKNWWDGRFGRRVNFTLTEENGTNREYEPVEVNVTGLAGSITDCNREIRIVYNGSDNKTSRQFEVPSQVLKSNEADGWCYVLFQANVTRNDTVQYFAYYNYSEPYFPDYSSQSTFRINPSDQQYCGFLSSVRETMQINWKGTNSSVEGDNALCFTLNDSFALSRKEQWHFDVGNVAAVTNMLAGPNANTNGFPFPFFSFIDASNNYLMSNMTHNGSLYKQMWVRYPGSATANPNRYMQLFVTIYDKWPLVKLDFFNTTHVPQFTSTQATNYTWYDASGINRTNKSTEPNTPQINELEPWFAISRYHVNQGAELGLIQYNGSSQSVLLNYTKHDVGAETSNIVGVNVSQNGTFWLGFFYNAKNIGDSPTREFYEAMQHPLRPRFGNTELVPEATTILTLYLDNFSSDKYYEFETTASLSVAFQVNMANFTFNSTGNLTICYDIITGEFGNNYVCGNITDVVEVNLTRLSENYFGNLTANATAMNRSNNGRFNTTIDNRTVLKLFTFNITGFASGGNYPENITFNILVNRTEVSLPGMLIGKDLIEDEFIVGGSTRTIHNLTYAQASSEKIFLNVSMIGVSQLEASIGSKNLTLNLSFNLSGFIVDANVSFRTADNFSTNAYINFTASYNATANVTSHQSNLSAWENFASNLTAAGINRWTYETLSGSGLIIQEYRGPTDYGNSIEKNNITLFGSSGTDGAARYYETEFDIRNLSRIDIDWFQLTSCGATSGSCSATTRVIVFDGTIQSTLRDYTSSCGPCFTSVSYSADENISIRKVDNTNFDVYVNGVFIQTVNLISLDTTKLWRLGFYGSESGTGSSEMDLHKISFNAIMAAKSGPWNNQYNKSLSVMSKPVDLVVDNITAATLEVVDLTVENFGQINRTFELSNNNGKDWAVVSLNSRRVFDSLGSDLVWRINCTATDTRDTCIISKVVAMVNPGQVNNITIDYGDDGIADFFFSGILNTSNSPIKVTNSSMPIWTHAKNNCQGALTCAVPVKITVGSEGIVQIGNVNRTQIISNITLNHTLFEVDTQLFWNATFMNGIIMLDDLKARYAGSRNFTIFAHFDGSGGFLSSNSQRMMNVITSFFNETLPKLISQFEIIPKTVNDKNLTPYGQNSTRPFLNITANTYDLPLNYSIALNQTPPSCIAIRIANNSNFANSAPLNTTRAWNKFTIAPKSTMGAWFQVDLNNCNASSLFNFNFNYESMSLCDRCVHTIDKDN